tara:strand:+ start:2219 stop:2968 length:750 start_codon:yes stop_codon:yes gene_type:complete
LAIGKEIKGVLVAGGTGSRLLPFTRYTHKTLLPLFDRPVIDYALDTMRGAGISDITIIANEHIGQIASHLGKSTKNERIHYVLEEEALGVANALRLARPYVEGHRIMLYFSDNITTWDFERDANEFSFSESNPGAVLLAREVEEPRQFGVCVIGKGGEVVDILEKPEEPPSNLAIGGIYLFDENFWVHFDSETEGGDSGFSISNITRRYVRAGKSLIRNVGEGTWIDCGTPENLLKASNMAALGKIVRK